MEKEGFRICVVFNGNPFQDTHVVIGFTLSVAKIEPIRDYESVNLTPMKGYGKN